MQDTREQILRLLQQEGAGTISTIAVAMNLATATIRHHLTILERDGLVEVEQVRQRVGRPHLEYSLTPVGRESFPKKYDEFSTQLLSEIRFRYGNQAVAELIRGIARRKLESIEVDLEKLDTAQRLEVLQSFLSHEGHVSSFKLKGNTARLEQHACPYQSIVMEHPEVCLLNDVLIRNIMDLPYEKQGCLVSGDDACIFEITLKA
ncbi:MAG: ArsR family transcriptional regulator [Anaerolineales bacterium]|nr:ArsR family transcriptional regulator [Anaerolineales bacterium]